MRYWIFSQSSCRDLLFIMAVIYVVAFYQPVVASQPQFQGSIEQGGLLLGKVPMEATVIYQGETLKLTAQGDFLLGFGRDAPAKVEVTVIDHQSELQTKILNVAPRTYDIQRIEGVPQKTVTPSATDLERIRNDASLVRAARSQETDNTDFLEGFILPLQGPITGVYGSQSVYNGIPGRPHYGIDYAAPTGTDVQAPAAGLVTLAHKDLFYSGGTLIIDHGHGLSSTFLHLSELLVVQGQRVNRGQPIAKVGATGRATGPHLDWRMNWRDQRIDPQLVLKTLPVKQ